MSEDDFQFHNECEWDAELDDYKSGNHSGADSDVEEMDVQAATCKYEANSVKNTCEFELE